MNALASILLLAGCPGDDPLPPPPAIADEAPCLLSADCPSGQHCDLGECVQDCNAELPCEGEASCSVRARCLPPDAPDEDAEPVPEFRGEVRAEPAYVLLDAETSSFTLTLTTTSPTPVRYRLESTSPHVRVREPRGTIDGTATVELDVDASGIEPGEGHGGIRIVTELGELYVDTPIQVGLTGHYRGSITYGNATSLHLGSAGIALDLRDLDGALEMRIDPESSLLFPETAGGTTPRAVTGRGAYNATDRVLDVVVQQVIGVDFAGPENPFGRPVGRRLRFILRPTEVPGALSGTFTEELTGVLPTTLRSEGTIALDFVPNHELGDFEVLPEQPLPIGPTAGDYIAPSDVFAWRDEPSTPSEATECRLVVNDVCNVAVPGYVARCRANPTLYADALYATLTQPLERSFAGIIDGNGYTSLATACEASIALVRGSQYVPTNPATRCGMFAPLGCLLDVIEGRGPDPVAEGLLYSRTLERFVQPALLVAKDHGVRGIRASFEEGAIAERNEYLAALDALRPAARWINQPAVLARLRSLPPAAARGDATVDRDTYPSLRAMADLFATASTFDAEIARIDASSGTVDRSTAARRAQERAVIALLESMIVSDFVATWRAADPETVVPESVEARFIGVLSPLDRAFTATLEGANVYGVPEGFVPFVYRPGTPEPTNFEQMLSIARTAIDAETIVEDSWREAGRRFDENEEATRDELREIRVTFDDRLRILCGTAFDPERPDWSACGAGMTGGSVGERLFAIQAAEGQVRVARARLEAQLDRIRVAENTAARVLRLRVEDLAFRIQTGEQILAIEGAQFVLHAIVKGLEIAAQAQLWNGGAPIAMGIVATALELVSGGLDLTKHRLQLAQEARSVRTDLLVEHQQHVQQIQNEWIAFQLLAVEAAETGVAVLQAKLAARNLLDEAFVLFEERERALGELNDSVIRDPAHRIVRDRRTMDVLRSRADAQRELSLAARALEYEINLPLPGIDGAVMNASSGERMRSFLLCLESIHNMDLEIFSAPVTYETRVSAREMLGITGPRTDEVTGQVLTEGDQFRQIVLRHQYLDLSGGVGIEFPTSLAEGNGLWSTDVCRDRIESVQAELVGDFLGDGEAQVNIALDGVGVMRDCSRDEIVPWSFGTGDASSAVAVVQAGVNTTGTAPPNTSLYGQPVARSRWRVFIPGPTRAPANADVRLTDLEDVVLVIRHVALPRRMAAFEPNLSCLSAGR